MADDSTAPPPAEPGAPPQRRNRLVPLAAVALLVAVVAAGIWFQTSRGDDDPTAGTPEVSAIPATPVDEGMSFATGVGPIIDIYVDYQCSHCADLDAVIGTELASLVAAEEAELVLRPVEFLSRASGRGAAALYCAAEGGQAYAMHQRMLANIDADFSPEGLTAMAAGMGLDEAEFDTCIRDRATNTWVNSVTDTAVADGIQGTPAVFVDGTRLSDAELTSGTAFRTAVLADGA